MGVETSAGWVVQHSSGSNHSHGEVSSPGDDEVVLQLKLGEPEIQVRLTRREVRELTLKRMASIWKVLVQKIGVCLPEAGRDPNSLLADRVAVRAYDFAAPYMNASVSQAIVQKVRFFLPEAGREPHSALAKRPYPVCILLVHGEGDSD